jgi:hypothetical protein
MLGLSGCFLELFKHLQFRGDYKAMYQHCYAPADISEIAVFVFLQLNIQIVPEIEAQSFPSVSFAPLVVQIDVGIVKTLCTDPGIISITCFLFFGGHWHCESAGQ